jgi:signal transduction histidine kinase
MMQKDYSLEMLNERLEQVEKKLSYLQAELVANKQNYYGLIQQLSETAILSDHQATVAKLAAGIAHEIRNPLTTVKGFIQLIQPYLVDMGKETYATIALDEIARADEIIFQFLNAAKPQQNQKMRNQIDPIVRDVVLLFESEALLQNIQLETHYNCYDSLVFLDGKQLKQVLINLIKNAMEAIDTHKASARGKLVVSTKKEHGFAYIIIEDNGMGMKEETLKNLFVPFFTTKKTGTGIGLSVCKQIIEDHGGDIIVISKQHKGTTFQIKLPLITPLSLIENIP